MALAHPKTARVLFDEAHSEAWTIRPELAREMQPAHPDDSSLARAAATLSARDFAVEAHTAGALDTAALAEADVLVIAHPSDPKWEAVTGAGAPTLAPDELIAIEQFVAAGGGLLVLGETEQEKYGNNLNELLARFGIQIANANLRLRMQKPHTASRLFGEALGELNTLSARKAAAAGDGFADGFPTSELATLLKAKIARPELGKADWVAFSAIGRT